MVLDASLLTDSVGQPGINAVRGANNPIKEIPFTAYVQVRTPSECTKRWEFLRHIEKMSHRVEDGLKSVTNIEIPNNIPWTINFAQKTARLTISGFYIRDGNTYPNVAPTSDVDIIHSGTDIGEFTGLINGNKGGSLTWGQKPTTALNIEMGNFLTDLTTGITANPSATSNGYDLVRGDIYYVVFNGVRYGRGGFSFPS